MRALLARERRAIWLGVIISGAAIVFRLSVGSREGSQRREPDWQREHALLLSERRLIEDDNRNRAELARLIDVSGAIDRRLLRGRAATTAAMALASNVRRLAGDAGIHALKCVDAGSDSLYGTIRAIRIQAEAQGSFDEIADLIRAIEVDSTRMRIADVEVIAPQTDGPALSSADLSSRALSTLRFRLTVVAVASIGPGKRFLTVPDAKY